MAWTNTGGGDHAGADWTPANLLEIAGTHTNIGKFTVLAGRTVYVKDYNGASYGALRIDAKFIDISGILSASEAGYGGGPGGGGGGGANGGWAGGVDYGGHGGNAGANQAGAGTAGAGLSCLNSADHAGECQSSPGKRGGNGANGGGTYKGNGGTYGVGGALYGNGANGTNATKGGYKASQTNGDTSTDETVYMGSGGGGGGGGGSGGAGDDS